MGAVVHVIGLVILRAGLVRSVCLTPIHAGSTVSNRRAEMSPTRQIARTHVKRAIARTRRELRLVDEAVGKGDGTAAYAAAERAQFAAFALKLYLQSGDPSHLDANGG